MVRGCGSKRAVQTGRYRKIERECGKLVTDSA
jgi:hypothetical protein